MECVASEPSARPSAAAVEGRLLMLMKLPQPKRMLLANTLPRSTIVDSAASGRLRQQGGGNGCAGSPVSPLAAEPPG